MRSGDEEIKAQEDQRVEVSVGIFNLCLSVSNPVLFDAAAPTCKVLSPSLLLSSSQSCNEIGALLTSICR